MHDFDTKTHESSSPDAQDKFRARIWEFIQFLIKRTVVLVSFGPGVLGVLWLLGRIFKR